MNELIDIRTLSFEEVSRLTGGSLNNTVILPQLKVNRDGETDDEVPVPLPLGSYCVSQDGKAIYGKTVKFRPFINAFQYQTYNPATEKYENKSVIIKNFFEEAFDELGGLKCGKVNRDQLEFLSAAEQERQKQIKCYRHMYGLLTMEGTSPPSKDKVIIEGLPVLWRMSASNFNAPKNALDAIAKMKHHMFQHNLILGVPKKEKKGTTTYYLINVETDFSTIMDLDDDDVATYKLFNDLIDRENRAILNKWKTSKKITQDNSDYINVSKELELDDEIPF